MQIICVFKFYKNMVKIRRNVYRNKRIKLKDFLELNSPNALNLNDIKNIIQNYRNIT